MNSTEQVFLGVVIFLFGMAMLALGFAIGLVAGRGCGA